MLHKRPRRAGFLYTVLSSAVAWRRKQVKNDGFWGVWGTCLMTSVSGLNNSEKRRSMSLAVSAILPQMFPPPLSLSRVSSENDMQRHVMRIQDQWHARSLSFMKNMCFHVFICFITEGFKSFHCKNLLETFSLFWLIQIPQSSSSLLKKRGFYLKRSIASRYTEMTRRWSGSQQWMDTLNSLIAWT